MLKFLTRALRVHRPEASARPRLRVEALADRLALSWPGVPPSTIPLPADAVAVSLNAQLRADGSAAITANENDFYGRHNRYWTGRRCSQVLS